MEAQQWFVIRITRNRTRSVFEKIVALHWPDVEVYCPCSVKSAFALEGCDIRLTGVSETLILPGFLFYHSTLADFRRLLEQCIPGLTPYYDHFHTVSTDSAKTDSAKTDSAKTNGTKTNGAKTNVDKSSNAAPNNNKVQPLIGTHNPYLTVPDQQMENFRRYCDAYDTHKLIDQHDVPAFLNGKRVRIISGPFAGVEGTVLRWHSMRRVFLTLGNLGTFGTGFVRACDFELLND